MLEQSVLDIEPRYLAKSTVERLAPQTLIGVFAVDTDNDLMKPKLSDNATNATNHITQLIAGNSAIYERDALVRLLPAALSCACPQTPIPTRSCPPG
jgi:hypothetical protein